MEAAPIGKQVSHKTLTFKEIIYHKKKPDKCSETSFQQLFSLCLKIEILSFLVQLHSIKKIVAKQHFGTIISQKKLFYFLTALTFN